MNIKEKILDALSSVFSYVLIVAAMFLVALIVDYLFFPSEQEQYEKILETRFDDLEDYFRDYFVENQILYTNDDIIEASGKAYDEGYEYGYDDGFGSGLEDGYEDGCSDGYFEGYDDGYQIALQDALERD